MTRNSPSLVCESPPCQRNCPASVSVHTEGSARQHLQLSPLRIQKYVPARPIELQIGETPNPSHAAVEKPEVYLCEVCSIAIDPAHVQYIMPESSMQSVRQRTLGRVAARIPVGTLSRGAEGPGQPSVDEVLPRHRAATAHCASTSMTAWQSTKFNRYCVTTVLKMVEVQLMGRPVQAAFTHADRACDVIGLLDAVDLRSAHLHGASIACALARALAVEKPQHLRTMTSIMATRGDPSLLPPRPEAMQVQLTPAPSDRLGATSTARKPGSRCAALTFHWTRRATWTAPRCASTACCTCPAWGGSRRRSWPRAAARRGLHRSGCPRG